MISSAAIKYIRVSPRKAREVADLVRGKSVAESFSILTNLNKRATLHVERAIKSAMHNALQKGDVQAEQLFVERIVVEAGPTLKRFRAEPMGRASVILKRTSHIKVELGRK